MTSTTALPGNGRVQSIRQALPVSNFFMFSSSFVLILSYLSTLPAVPVFAVAPPPAKIQEIWPGIGSLAGGTYLVIRGVGWSRGGLPGTTRAFINNKECIQNQGVILDSTDTNFVCWTPPRFEPGQEFPDTSKDWWAVNAVFNVHVEITTGDGQIYSAACDGHCSFQYREDRTPIVGYASLGGHAGSLVKFYGTFREKDVSKYWVRIGGQVGGGGFQGALCNVDPTIQLGWRQVGGAAISDPNSNRMYVSSSFLVCRVPSGNATVEAGRYPLFLEPRDIAAARDGFGQAFFSMNAPQTPTFLTRTPPSGGGRPVAMQSIGMGFTVRPLIESVSATEFGLNGGSLLTIIGSGFSIDGNNEVLIGHNNVPCTIVQSNARQIVCRTGSTYLSTPSPQPNKFYPGGQGLLSLVYQLSAMPSSLVDSFSSYRWAWANTIGGFPTTRNATSGKFLASFVEPTSSVNFPPTFAEVTADSLTSRHFYYGSTATETDYYLQELTGFFVPPVSAFYSFYTRGDDQVVLWLSSDDDPRNAEVIAISRFWEFNWWMSESSARISQKIWCAAGVPRYFRLMFVEWYNADFFDVAIRVHSDNGTNSQVMQLLASDTQRMVRSAPLVQRVEISCDSGSFAIELDLGTGPILTEPIACNADTLKIRNAIATASKNDLGKVWANVLDFWIAYDFDSGWEFQLDRGGSGIYTRADYSVTDKINRIFIRCYGALVVAMKPLKFLLSGDRFSLSLQNGNASVSYILTEQSYGDPFYWPAPMDFFRVAMPVPPIQVLSNGLLSVCQHVQPISTSNLTQIQRQRFNAPGWLGQFDPVNLKAITSASQLNGCAAVYDALLTPTVVSVVAYADTVVVGSLITITGTNFLTSNMGIGKGHGLLNLTVAEMNLVFFNGTGSSNFGALFPCPVVSTSATQIVCETSEMSLGPYSIFVEIGLGRGRAVDQSVKILTFVRNVSSIAPLRGSRAGGTVLTIAGIGFCSGSKLKNNIVMIGTQACNITSATTRLLTCVTPPTTDATATPTAIENSAPAVLVDIVVNGVAFESKFKYEVSATPLVTLMSPTAVSSAVTGTINFTLTNINSSVVVGGFISNVSVMLSNRVCEVSSVSVHSSSTVLSCILKRTLTPPMPQQRLMPIVAVANLGFAALDAVDAVPSGGWKLDSCFRVSSVSPSLGSLAGGTTVSVFGCGFTAALSSTSVRFERPSSQSGQAANTVSCTVSSIAADGSSLKCVMSRPSYEYVPEFAALKNSTQGLQGVVIVTANLIDSICADATSAACGFSFSTAATPVVTSAQLNMTRGIVTGSSLVPPVNVFIGTFVCRIISVDHDNSTVQFEIPPLVAGMASLRVHSGVYGSAEGAWGFNLTNPLQVSNVTLIDGSATLSGSVQGGQLLVITGNGFSENPTRNVVSIGNVNAIVISAEPSKLIVATPANVGSSFSVIVSLTQPTTTTVMYSVTTNFLFVYDPNVAFTASIISVNPTSVSLGTTLTVTGNGFGTASANSSVEVGSAACHVSSWNATNIICTVGSAVAGTHSVLVFTTLYGLAKPSSASANQVNVALVVNSVVPLVVGMHGGAAITLQGSGFASPSTAARSTQPSISVLICGRSATVLSSNSTHLLFLSPKFLSTALNDQFNPYEHQVLTGDVAAFGSPISSLSHAFDSLPSTEFAACTVQMDVGAFTAAVVSKIRFFPKMGDYGVFANSVFSAANSASGPWNTLLIVGAAESVTDGWNVHELGLPQNNLTGQPKYRYLRWQAAVGSSCKAMELEFVGLPMIDGSEPASCPVSLTTQLPIALPYITSAVTFGPVLPANITLSSALTPAVADISPSSGSALGGDTITITGIGFQAGGGIQAVRFNGMECAVASFNDSQISCVTGRRSDIRPFSVEVIVRGVGAAVVRNPQRTYFSYLDRWSSLTTWANREAPVDGDTVIVPKGQAILVDVSTPKLFLVVVQGEVYFEDVRDLTFEASYIVVVGGKFILGTESRPHLNKVTITLYGNRSTAVEIPDFGAKCLGVMNGMSEGNMGSDAAFKALASSPGAIRERNNLAAMRLLMGADFALQLGVYETYNTDISPHNMMDMLLSKFNAPSPGEAVPYEMLGVIDIHGAPRLAVWTFGSRPALAGSRVIVTREDVDWMAGEEIVITGTSWAHNEAERVRVVRVDQSRTITIDRPLVYNHDCFVYPSSQFSGFTDTSICFEVALLSRNIVIQGDAGSVDDQFGMHSIAAMGAVFRLENAELRNCGQSLVVGRYCAHIHLNRDEAANSYIKHNSFHDSFQRAVTVHASNNLLIQNNVAYRVMAHSFFVEDGVEMNNVFDRNLVIEQLTSPGPIRSDSEAACFWTASPANIWRNNVCAGSQSNGWWFQPPSTPTGPSATDRIIPHQLPLGAFTNNIAHGTGKAFHLWLPLQPILCNPVNQQMINNTFWRNGIGMIIGMSSASVQYAGNKLLENSDHDLQWFHTCNSRFSWRPQIKDTLFVASMDNAARPSPRKGALLVPESEFFYISGATFVNYGETGALNHCRNNGCVCFWSRTTPLSADALDPHSFTARVDRLRFVNTTLRVWFERTQQYWDLDGSLSGWANSSVIPYKPYNDWPECRRDASGSLGDALVCPPSSPARKVIVNIVEPSILASSAASVTSESYLAIWGPANRTASINPTCMLLVSGHYYGLSIQNAQDLTKWSITYSEPDYLYSTNRRAWVGLTVKWIQKRFNNPVYFPSLPLKQPCTSRPCPGQIEIPLAPTNTLPPVDSIFGTANYPSNNTWTVMLTSNLPSSAPLFNSSYNGKGSLESSNVFSIDVDYNQCPPIGCIPLPASGALGAPVMWSTLTWPEAGADIEIGPTQWIMLDVNPPPIGKLTVLGRLEFVDNFRINTILTAQSIVVFGSLVIGSAASPFSRSAEIALTGNVRSPDVVVDSASTLGNKALVVYGNVTMIGKSRGANWVRLLSTAVAGSSQLILSSNVSWSAGDTIVVGTTEYTSWNNSLSETETATIAAVSSDGKTLTLSSPLRFRHFAGRLSSDPSSPVFNTVLGAAVGVLTRNVKVYGDMSAESSEPHHGGHILVTAVTLGGSANRMTFRGRLELRHVEVRDMGQQEFPFAAVDVDFRNGGTAPHPATIFEGCAFNRGYNSAVRARSARNTLLLNNVFFSSSKSSVWFDPWSTGTNVTGNLVSGNFLSPWTYDSSRLGQPKIFFQAAISMESLPVALVRNCVAGAFDTGFFIPGSACDQPFMADNEAVGASVGFLIRPTSGCVLVSDLTAWKSSHIGILVLDAGNALRVTNSIVADSHIGLSMRFAGTSKSLMWNEVINTTFVGSSLASTCNASITCRAMILPDRLGVNCNSMFRSFRRVGFLVPQYVSNTAMLPGDSDGPFYANGWQSAALPWDMLFGAAAGPYSASRLINTRFVNFRQSDCSLPSIAVSMNPGEFYLTVPVIANNVTWWGVDQASKIWLGSGPRPLFNDVDGSLLGNGPDSQLMTEAMATETSVCSPSSAWNTSSGSPAYLCRGLRIRGASLQNVDRATSQSGNVMSDLSVIRKSSSDRTTVYGSVGEEGDTIHFLLLAGSTTMLQLRSTEAVQNRIYFNSPDPNEKVLVQMFLTRPNSQSVFVNGVPVQSKSELQPDADPKTLPLPSLADPVGTSLFRADQKIIYLVVGGGFKYFDIIRNPSVMLSMVVQPSSSGAINIGPIVQGLASLLGINPARIRVVNVGGGSLLSSSLATRQSASNATSHRTMHLLQAAGQKLDIEILDDKPTAPIDTVDSVAPSDRNSSSSASSGSPSAATPSAASASNQLDAASQQVRMAVLGTKLATLAASGSIAQTLITAGVTVSGLNVTIPQVSVAPPVADAAGSAGSPFVLVSINITFSGAPRSKFAAAVAQLQAAIAGALHAVTASMVLILSISEVSSLQSSLRVLGAPHGHAAAARQALSGPFVTVSSSVNFSSAVAAMTSGFSLSSDPQTFAAAVTSALSRAVPADFSSLAVASLMLGNVPGVSGTQNFTIPKTHAMPQPVPPTVAPAAADGGLSAGLIAAISIGGVVLCLIGGLVWWKLKSSSRAAVWPEEKSKTAVVKFAPALDVVVATSASPQQASADVSDRLKKIQKPKLPH